MSVIVYFSLQKWFGNRVPVLWKQSVVILFFLWWNNLCCLFLQSPCGCKFEHRPLCCRLTCLSKFLTPMWLYRQAVLLGTGKNWGINSHTTGCTRPVSIISQHKLVNGWELKRSAPPHEPMRLGKEEGLCLLSFYQYQYFCFGIASQHGGSNSYVVIDVLYIYYSQWDGRQVQCLVERLQDRSLHQSFVKSCFSHLPNVTSQKVITVTW